MTNCPPHHYLCSTPHDGVVHARCLKCQTEKDIPAFRQKTRHFGTESIAQKPKWEKDIDEILSKGRNVR